MWTLFICTGMFLGLCSQVHQIDYPDEKRCLQAKREFVQESLAKADIIYCKPKTASKGEAK